MRYFLVDKVTEIVPGERIRGVKAVSLSDDVLHDHFPDLPVMPGMLLLEGAAQLSGLLLEMSLNDGGGPVRRAVLAAVESAKFHETAGPGDLVEYEARIESTLPDAAKVAITAAKAGRRVAKASLTFVMRAIDKERIHEQRRYIYGLWTKDLEDCPPLP